MKGLLLFFALIFSSTTFARNFFCTEWAQLRNVTCVFAGNSADVWARQCENPCSFGNFGPHCDLTRICLDEDPNTLTTPCSRWVREFGVSCNNPSTGLFEQKWVRACQIGLATTWCSDVDPNRN